MQLDKPKDIIQKNQDSSITSEQLIKTYLEPKVTETKTIKVEDLQTSESEDGFVMPEVAYVDIKSDETREEE